MNLYQPTTIGYSVTSGSALFTGDVTVLGTINATVSGSINSASFATSASYALSASYAPDTTYPYTGSATISGSLTVTGSLNVSKGITGSLLGTAATASYVLQAVSASYATTASFAQTATDFTASSILVNGSITAQTLVVQTVTASVEYSSGSNIFGSLLSNTQQLTGSVTITGSLSVNGKTPLYLDQTASLTVTSASYAATASYGNSTAVAPFKIGQTSIYYGTVNSSTVGSNNVFTIDTGSFTAAFYKYTVFNGSNARSGEVFAVWNNGSTSYTDISTADIGNTSNVTASVVIASAQAQLNFQTNTSGWTVKSQATFI
jgi:hypothetical protein